MPLPTQVEEDQTPECPVRAAITENHWRAPISEFMALLRAHEAVPCVYCGSNVASVAADREHVNPAAVCCGEVA